MKYCISIIYSIWELAPKKEEVKGPEGAEYFHFDNSALPIRKRAQKERSKSDENLNVKVNRKRRERENRESKVFFWCFS